MASQEPQQPSDTLDPENRDDKPDSSSTPPSQHENSDELESEQEREPKGASSTAPQSTSSQEPEWAHGFQLFNVMAAVTFVSFLMLLDGTIVVAAVPRITDDFKSLNDIGWYGAAYQLER